MLAKVFNCYHIASLYSLACTTASELFDKGTQKYNMDFKKPEAEMSPKAILTGEGLAAWWVEMAGKYPVVLLEDPADEADFATHALITSKLGAEVEIVGDDLYCTNPKIVAKGVAEKATNARLLKVNQMGSVRCAFRLLIGYGDKIPQRPKSQFSEGRDIHPGETFFSADFPPCSELLGTLRWQELCSQSASPQHLYQNWPISGHIGYITLAV